MRALLVASKKPAIGGPIKRHELKIMALSARAFAILFLSLTKSLIKDWRNGVSIAVKMPSNKERLMIVVLFNK